MTIVTEFDKFKYNRLPMVMCALVYIFQEKVENILGDIKSFIMYIDDILFLIWECFYNHVYHLIVIYAKMRSIGLKRSWPKFSFGLNDIP